MCIIAAKYFKNVGWVGVKNRDRKYKPTIHIKQSFRNDVERMYIWDERTKYTEGLNEYGLCILSSAIIGKIAGQESEYGMSEDPNFQSPDGKSIRTALFERDPEKAIKVLQNREVEGNTIIFTKERCLMMEAYFKDKENKEGYVSKWKEIPTNEVAVRTNHLHWLPGNPPSEDPEIRKRNELSLKSSEKRWEQVMKDIKDVEDWKDMLNCVSYTGSSNLDYNTMRLPKTHGSSTSHTTGQIMLVPELRTLHYKPLWGDVDVDFNKVNSIKSKTFCEIISAKKLLSFKEWAKGY